MRKRLVRAAVLVVGLAVLPACRQPSNSDSDRPDPATRTDPGATTGPRDPRDPSADAGRSAAADREPRRLSVGDQAPDFALEGSDGRTYRLSDYRGKQAVVLAWFARAFSAGWTAQCQSLRESGDAIRAFNAAHFAASVDTPENLRKFAHQLAVDYPVLSDPTRTVAKAYGVVKDDSSYAVRWTFFIGQDGRILYIDKNVRPGTHGKSVAEKLAELGVPLRPRATSGSSPS